jgi:hypothetical protein
MQEVQSSQQSLIAARLSLLLKKKLFDMGDHQTNIPA